MKPVQTVLANGLRVVTCTMPHVETSSLGLWVGVGSRHETEAEHGISHFLEHMSFKGTASRSAQAIAEEIEAVGGELNAATGLETTGYFARVLKGDEGLALELIADILLNSSFRADELERERQVILQEIASTQDSPDDVAFELAHEAAYPGQAVGRPILGTPENVRRFTEGDLRAFLKAHYSPGRMVLSAAGAVNHQAFVRHAEALFGRLTDPGFEGSPGAFYEGGARWFSKRFEQSHVVAGFEGPSYRDSDYIAAQVFSGLFGGGMSSRLFQEVRERRGLCYAIYSSAFGLKDTGMFAVHAASGADTMEELIGVVGAELNRVGADGPEPAEVKRAKAQIKAGLMMNLESSSAWAEQMARQLLTMDRLLPVEELIAKVDAVGVGEVRDVVKRIASSRPSIAVAGAGKSSKKLALLAAARMAEPSPRGGAWYS